MSERQDDFLLAMDEYKSAFGEYFPTEMFYGGDRDMVELMRRAVREGKPYEPDIPDGSIA